MSRHGFTLVETMVALALGSIVVLLAHGLMQGVSDGSRRMVAARRELDRTQNARRVLVELVGSLQVGESSGSFEGSQDAVTFSTWRLGADASWRRTRVTIRRTGAALTASGPGFETMRLADSVVAFDVDYLVELGEGATWQRTWVSAVTAPYAVRLRTARRDGRESGGSVAADTVLLIVGYRG